MIYIGIDPGHNGGIGILFEDGYQSIVYSDFALREICECYKDAKVFVEKVGAMPGQGVVSMFNFGQSYGYIMGVLEANRMKYNTVTPQRWKKDMGVTKDKQTSIEVCQRLFPKACLFRTNRCKNKHDGMAEALLIAEWGRRNDCKQ